MGDGDGNRGRCAVAPVQIELQQLRGDGLATENTYDELNRMRQATQAAGTADQVVTESVYDAAGNVIALILRNSAGNGGDQVTTYTFDAYKRKLTETLPAVADAVLRQTQFTYRPNGTVATTRDPKGQLVEVTYDRANRPVQTVYRRADTSVEETITTTYSKSGKPLSVSDVTGTSVHLYDALDRPLSETRTPVAGLGQPAYTVTSDFDAMGNRTRVVYPGTSRTLITTVDRAGRVVTINDSGKVTSSVYDANGNRTRCTTPNLVATETTFDALNRATLSVSAKGAAQTARFAYAFDLVGNRRSVIETLAPQSPRTVTYGYDAQYRLTSETTAGFSQTIAYDPAGNRTQLTRVEGATTTVTTYQCDRLNRLLSSNSSTNGGAAQVTTYAYDLNGNQISQAIPGYPVIAMQWDVHNRLIGGNAMGVTAGAAASYDYRTRRQTKANATDVTFFRYDQGDAFQEFKASAMQVEFVRGGGMGGGIGSILYSDRTAAGGTEETFTYNGSVGHVVAMTDLLGMTTETNRFDAFGNIIGTTGFSLNNRLANTKERDVSIPGVFTLDNHGFRYYNPVTGRYISKDPLGYKDGLNNYLYVHNNPINRIDPLGLYDAAGHFWTTYIVAKAAGMSNSQAMKLAYYSQLPDQRGHTDAIGPAFKNAAGAFINQPSFVEIQAGGHMLLGQKNTSAVNKVRENMHNYVEGKVGNLNSDSEESYQEAGFAIHAYGDSYSHAKQTFGPTGSIVTSRGAMILHGPTGEIGFEHGVGHADPKMPDLGKEHDYINHGSSTYQNDKYKKYVEGLYAALGGKDFAHHEELKAFLEKTASMPNGHARQAQLLEEYARKHFGYDSEYTPGDFDNKNKPEGVSDPAPAKSKQWFRNQLKAATENINEGK